MHKWTKDKICKLGEKHGFNMRKPNEENYVLTRKIYKNKIPFLVFYEQESRKGHFLNKLTINLNTEDVEDNSSQLLDNTKKNQRKRYSQKKRHILKPKTPQVLSKKEKEKERLAALFDFANYNYEDPY